MTCGNREQSLSWPSSLWPDPARAARSRPAGGTASAHRAATCPCPHSQTASSHRCSLPQEGASSSWHLQGPEQSVCESRSVSSVCLHRWPRELTCEINLQTPVLSIFISTKKFKILPFSISSSVSQSARSFLDSGFRYLTVQL